ncbi:ATP-grasp domain-containing protein [Halobacillus litoralis]|uniref:ATP-grasp domain-containing protein n=1 Tax=Halobacillus litoralis TaxID=45668 RepID=UPI001CD7B46E|nr:ATP-grasp domain-containing protein [Halobacillus litoralis]MCA0971487.1 ATP-grasp domain-containing protein [Halobacillus litoralis]
MLILENQIVSPFLVKTALNLSVPIYYKEDQRTFELGENDKVLTNSESCLSLLEERHPEHPHTRASHLVKDKAEFRKLLSSIDPDYFFRRVTLDELLKMDRRNVPYPVVIKPNRGYSSVGVYIVQSKEDWDEAVRGLYSDLVLSKQMYSDSVVDGEDIIVEEWIDGQEFAFDCYFDRDGNPVVLSVLKRIFSSDQDTSDRIYYTSSNVVREIQEEIMEYLHVLNDHLQLRNYPFHMEVRRTKEKIIPIEVNPLRFAGIGTTDVSEHAFGVQAAEYYFQDQVPDWEQLVESTDNSIYGFFCADVPLHISRNLIEEIQHEKLKEEFHCILEYRNLETANDRTFAVIFFKAESMDELRYLLNIDLEPFIKLKREKEEVK